MVIELESLSSTSLSVHVLAFFFNKASQYFANCKEKWKFIMDYKGSKSDNKKQDKRQNMLTNSGERQASLGLFL